MAVGVICSYLLTELLRERLVPAKAQRRKENRKEELVFNNFAAFLCAFPG
jgi:hypothetical protein